MFERRLRGNRRLMVATAIASAAAMGFAAAAWLRGPAGHGGLPTRVDELTVGRLNVVEPDGTPRMILSNRAQFPGMPVRGKDIPRPDRRDLAGMLFVNDEGTENGGLVQNGAIDASGKATSGLSLTFDRFRQDQMLQLLLDESGAQASAGVIVNDQPSYQVFSIDDLMKLGADAARLPPAERDAALARHRAEGHLSRRRAYFGTQQGRATLVLSDPEGRPRLRLAVSEHGEPSIELLDAAGTTVRTIDARSP